MANEIVKMVAKKANIAEPIAQIAVDVVLNALKDKLPAGVGGILDSFMGSSGSIISKSTKNTSASASKSTKTTKTTKSAQPAKKNDDLLSGLGNIAAGALSGFLNKK